MGENDANICKHRLPLCITGINMAIAVINIIQYYTFPTCHPEKFTWGLFQPSLTAKAPGTHYEPRMWGWQNDIQPSWETLRPLPRWACFDPDLRLHGPGRILMQHGLTLEYLREISFALVCSPHFSLPFMSFYFFDAPRQLKIQHSTHIMIASQCQQSRWLMTCISAMMICDDPMVRTLGCLIQSHSNILSCRRLLDLGEIALLRKKTRRVDSSL